MRALILIVALMGACAGPDCPSEAKGLVRLDLAAQEGDCVTAHEVIELCADGLDYTSTHVTLRGTAVGLVGGASDHEGSGTTCEPEALAVGIDGRSARVRAVYTGDGWDLTARVSVPASEFGGAYSCCYVGRMAPSALDI
jgi:hypothetical protein